MFWPKGRDSNEGKKWKSITFHLKPLPWLTPHSFDNGNIVTNYSFFFVLFEDKEMTENVFIGQVEFSKAWW